jgi:SAM-dependent methyltransferase
MSTFTYPEAAEAYNCLAPFYDGFTEAYDYEGWLAKIEDRARSVGLCGKRALDVACGTGKSAEPLLARGYSVLACDISPEMLAQARGKFPGHAEAFQLADMRALPHLGEFDLILCLDDAINYLLSQDELEATFAGVADCLAPSGVFVFDVNALAAYRSFFAQTTVSESEQLFFAWRGEADPQLGPGQTATARVEIFSEREDGLWERRFMRHVQRHHPPETITAALKAAGLDCQAIVGQRPGSRMDDTFDEDVHIKLLYFCRHSDV